MYSLVEWTPDLDLTEFYAEAELRGFVNNASQQMLIDQISYLREMLNTADQLPGKDAYDRFNSLKIDVDNLLRKWKDKSNIPGFTH